MSVRMVWGSGLALLVALLTAADQGRVVDLHLLLPFISPRNVKKMKRKI